MSLPTFQDFTPADWGAYQGVEGAHPKIAEVTSHGCEWDVIKDGRTISANTYDDDGICHTFLSTFDTYHRAEWVAAAILHGTDPTTLLEEI